MKKSFLLYYDQCEIFKELSDEEAGRLIKAICFDDQILDKQTKLLLHPFRISLQRDNEKSRQNKFHWNWKGGISEENHVIRTSAEYKNWRKLVFERDDFRCQSCSERGGTIHAHHVIPFSENLFLRLEVDNGLTLCKKCHIKIHKDYEK